MKKIIAMLLVLTMVLALAGCAGSKAMSHADYMAAAMESTSADEAYKYWQLAQWDGESGTAMQGDCPWVWVVNLDHIYFVRDGLSIGEQPVHPHGHSIPLIQNLQNWHWET